VKFKESEPQNKALDIQDIIKSILQYMGCRCLVEKIKDTDEEIVYNIKGDGTGRIIGKHGEVLDALQYIINKIANKSSPSRKRIVLDSEGYQDRRIESIAKIAMKCSEKVKRYKKPITLSPMNARDRRIVHITLQNERSITTKSLGDGYFKKVMIIPKKAENSG